MKKLFLFLIAVSISAASFAQTKWTVDPMHSFVSFSVKHSGISFVEGSFKKFDGSFVSDKEDLTDAKIDFTVDVNSISTSVEMRDNHLKTDDFFNAEKYPKMTFESTTFKKIKGNTYALAGKLTIRDVTKNVVFAVTHGGTITDQKGVTKAGFTATTNIDRMDYNIKYDPTGAGIAKDIKVTINLQFVKAK